MKRLILFSSLIILTSQAPIAQATAVEVKSKDTHANGLIEMIKQQKLAKIQQTNEKQAKPDIDNMTKEAFIDLLGQDAKPLAEEADLYASVMIAQAVLESGFGTSLLSKTPYFNLFGIKGMTDEHVMMDTLEEENGQVYAINDGFRVYPSYKESMKDYVNLIKNGITENKTIYQNAWKSKATTYKEATNALVGVYATDSSYDTKLNTLIEKYQLERFDTPKKEVKPKAPNEQYKIVAGDTLSDIAVSKQVTLAQLKEWNPTLTEINLIIPGNTLSLMKQPTSAETPKQMTKSYFSVPLKDSYTISSEFGLRDAPTSTSGNDHLGIDLAAATGTSVYPSASGTVEQTGFDPSAGNYVIIKHDAGTYTNYFHLNSIATTVGQTVTTETVIGTVGTTGDSTGAHLHFGISDSPWSDYHNPRELLQF